MRTISTQPLQPPPPPPPPAAALPVATPEIESDKRLADLLAYHRECREAAAIELSDIRLEFKAGQEARKRAGQANLRESWLSVGDYLIPQRLVGAFIDCPGESGDLPIANDQGFIVVDADRWYKQEAARVEPFVSSDRRWGINEFAAFNRDYRAALDDPRAPSPRLVDRQIPDTAALVGAIRDACTDTVGERLAVRDACEQIVEQVIRNDEASPAFAVIVLNCAPERRSEFGRAIFSRTVERTFAASADITVAALAGLFRRESTSPQ